MTFEAEIEREIDLLLFLLRHEESGYIRPVLYRGYVFDRVHRDLRNGNGYLPPRRPENPET